jgi:hypothetical protein
MAKIQNTDDTKFWWGCGATRNYHSLVGKQNGAATLKDWLFLMKSYVLFPYKSINLTPCNLPKEVENLCLHKNVHMDVYSSSIYNCPNLKIMRMVFSPWIGKLWWTYMMNYYLALERKVLSSQVWWYMVKVEAGDSRV